MDNKNIKDDSNGTGNQDKFVSKRWLGCSVEEEYFGEERKSAKMQRKIASAKDRSKYKKTDRHKKEKQDELHKDDITGHEHLSKGRVLSITPQGIVVEFAAKIIICALRGIMKKDKSQFKNLVTVGDLVLFEEVSPGEGYIAAIEPRRTVLSRADNLSRRKEQLIAANIDQVIITTSVVFPQLKPSLIDRYIIAASKGGMEAVIVVNKIDLLDDALKDSRPEIDDILLENEKEMFAEFSRAYQASGVPVIAVSVKTGSGIEDLRAAMKDKVSVFSGQSGVGKSSLINIITGLDLRIGKVVERTKKGSHTTTTANLIPLPFGGWCIDTPGIKSFGVWDLKKEEIEQYFSEIYECGRECKYPDCSHTNEKECAVAAAVESGKISILRYQSYIYLLDSVSRDHVRR